jgi:hypothetical protein
VSKHLFCCGDQCAAVCHTIHFGVICRCFVG